jgi:prophage antirepressor-like protein
MTFSIITNETLNCELKYILSSDEGDIWFRGKTVATVLGYSDTSQSIRKHVEQDDTCKLRDFERDVISTPLTNNEKNTIMINESGLYSLILGSKLETAKKFKRWVTKEVLPSIRKTGKYEVIVDEEPETESLLTDITYKIDELTESLDVVKACWANTWQKKIYTEMIEESYVNGKCHKSVMIRIHHLEGDRKRIEGLPFHWKTKKLMYEQMYEKVGKIRAHQESGSLDWLKDH